MQASWHRGTPALVFHAPLTWGRVIHLHLGVPVFHARLAGGPVGSSVGVVCRDDGWVIF